MRCDGREKSRSPAREVRLPHPVEETTQPRARAQEPATLVVVGVAVVEVVELDFHLV